MTVRELLKRVRDKLQDTEGEYWSDSELLDLHNEAKRYLSAERKESPTNKNLVMYSGTYEYEVEGVLRYISIQDSKGYNRPLYPDDGSGSEDADGVIVLDYNRLYVNNPSSDVTLNIKHISFPEEDNLNNNIRMGDENSMLYYILSKAYEKDNDMEQFQKANYFQRQFLESMKANKKNNSVQYIENQNTTKVWYF